jgi:transcriptional regulator NrdR family protein
MYQFMKKDGTLEDFDRNKIVAAVIKAGGSNQDGDKVAADVESWLPSVATGGPVKSQDVRAKVLEVLGIVNPAAAAGFAAYQKPV